MTIQELFIRSNEMEEKVVAQIGEGQWGLMMPRKTTREPMTVDEVVRFHIWDDAWIPDGLAGKTLEDIGDAHGHLLKLYQQGSQGEFHCLHTTCHRYSS